jgi:hypothetical protein
VLTVLLPVIRFWTCEAVCGAIEVSDIPRERAIIIEDAPGCGVWEECLRALGFDCTVYRTGNDHPPEDRLVRRPRWREMRRLSQALAPDGPLLCIEDDVLVCPDIYARLANVGPHVTGVVVGRHSRRKLPVVYPLRTAYPAEGTEDIEGCGYNCLLTTGEAYKEVALGYGPGPADIEHTAHLRPLRVDWGCRCGHITEGGVLWP